MYSSGAHASSVVEVRRVKALDNGPLHGGFECAQRYLLPCCRFRGTFTCLANRAGSQTSADTSPVLVYWHNTQY